MRAHCAAPAHLFRLFYYCFSQLLQARQGKEKCRSSRELMT
jgi:hypothetical protein